MRPADQSFEVRLHGARIGALHRHDDYTWFTFDEAYLSDPHRAVLGLRFEEDLHARYAASLRVPPWFSNLLPEGPLRAWIAQGRGVSTDREMELLAEVGRDLPGAVQVIEADESIAARRGGGREVLARAPDSLPDTLWHYSLAGVALKFSMLAEGERFTAPAVGERGDWILKLPDRNHRGLPHNELAMMTLAQCAGIDVPDVRRVHRDLIDGLPDAVWPNDEPYAYAVRRFDRDEAREPVHIEDLAQVRGVYPDDKYKGTFETVAALIYRQRDDQSLMEFARRLAFHVLIENGDAHLKNWSLIYRDRRVPTLAPAYDLVATSFYRPPHATEDLGLKFCGSRRFDGVTLGCFTALQNKLGTSVALADVVVALVDRVRAAWPEAAALLADQPAMREAIGASIERHAVHLRRR